MRYIALLFSVILVSGCGTTYDANYQPPVITQQGFEIINFYADWCRPCQLMAPIIEEHNVSAKVKIQRLNVDRDRVKARQVGIQGIPVTVLFHDGQEIARLSGFRPLADIQSWVSENVD